VIFSNAPPRVGRDAPPRSPRPRSPPPPPHSLLTPTRSNSQADKGDDDAKSEYKDAVADAKSDFEVWR
jgi:hypothetical protein